LTFAPEPSTIAPDMSARVTENGLAAALFGKTRRSVLTMLYGHADESFYVREIASFVGSGQGAVQRELKRLSAAGIIVRRSRGRHVYYQANRGCPIFEELAGLIRKTAGLADVLREALSPLAGVIDVAFVYGSLADGTPSPGSDVDVMVIGDVGFGQVVEVLHSAQEQLLRDVNPAVYTRNEFRAKIEAGQHFVSSVLARKKVFLMGNSDELDRLAGKESS